MGLDFDRSDANWSYGGFNRFRTALAAEIGIQLEKMQGYCSNGVPWSRVSDPIVPLLNHSDCDGELSPDECAAIAPRLRELVASWPDGHDKQNALLLADDMEGCAKDGEPLVFC